MKFFYAASLLLIGLCDTAFGVSVVVKDNEVYMDDKRVDLTKLQVIKETDLYKKYVLHSGDSTITITKSKVGNAVSVESVGPMTPEEKKKMEDMQKQIEDKVAKEMKDVQKNMDKFQQQLDEKMSAMEKKLQNMFSGSFPF